MSWANRGAISRCLVSCVLAVSLSSLVAGCSHFRDPGEEPLEKDARAAAPQLPPEPVTPPLDFSGFDAGNIIPDEVFYDADAMSIEEIQQFLEEAGEGCRTGSVPCLQDYVEDTPTISGGQTCTDYIGLPGESAAVIIYWAGQHCGINPQVLLVMLQKEQGLITASGRRLDEAKYDIAMGYACPDWGNCDPDFFGFTQQVFGAAKQLRRYGLRPDEYDVVAGEENAIAFHPDPECGSENVLVQNNATAALYNYTPYQPGGGADCQSVGNLNFYAYFKAWFG